MTELNPLTITIKDFDQLGGDHVFSDSYRARKYALLREADRVSAAQAHTTRQGRAWHFPRLAIAAAVAACIALPVGAYAAANHDTFFAGAFGTGALNSVAAADHVQAGAGDKADVHVTLPAKEYVDINPEVAEALLGQAVMDEPVVVKSDDGHVLTITSAVRSEHAMAFSYTLEREGGVNALVYSDLTNRTKGAFTAQDAQMSWAVAGDEFDYVDLERSTADKVVGYGFTVFGEAIPAGQDVEGVLWNYSLPVNQAASEECKVTETTFSIPAVATLEDTVFTNEAGGTINLSAIGLLLDNETGLFEVVPQGDYSMAEDPVWTRAITLHFANGESYTVFNNDENIDNTHSLCGFDRQINMAFNRIVDPASITSIDVAVVDAEDPDTLLDENGNWLQEGAWPLRTVTYTVA